MKLGGQQIYTFSEVCLAEISESYQLAIESNSPFQAGIDLDYPNGNLTIYSYQR